MTAETIEISVKGKWLTVPAIGIEGKKIVVKGRFLRTATVEGEEWMETELQDPELCSAVLKQQTSPNLRADILTFSQKVPDTQPKYSYPMDWESVAAASTFSYDDWWKGLPQETRKNVRKSQKSGVVVSVKELDDELIRGIVDVNNESPFRQGVPFVHYGKTFEQVKKDQSSHLDRSDFICAYLGSELVGFMKIVRRGNIASILQFLPKFSHQDKKIGNALIAKGIEVCESKGIAYLTYGLFNYGNKPDNPLRDFKIRNGFREVLVPKYYVPLNRKGAVCIRLGIHRDLIGILPPRVISLIVDVRSRWYRLKQRTSRCSSTLERPNRYRQMERSIPPAGSNISSSSSSNIKSL